jgi:hypothetical protein
MAAKPQTGFGDARDSAPGPQGRAQSSVLHDFARSGPTKEAHPRALHRPDGHLRSVAGQGAEQRDGQSRLAACQPGGGSRWRWRRRPLGWQPSRFLTDRAEAERAFQLAERLGSVRTGETPSSAGPFLPKGDFVTEPRDLTDADRLHISLGQRVRERVAVDRRGAGSVTRAPQGRSAAAAQALPGPRRDGL